MSDLCYTVVADDGADLPGTPEVRAVLEKGTDDIKLEMLRRIIVSTINGAAHPNLLMPIIQYVMPSRNKLIKKLLHAYWEVCPKYDDDGQLRQEMILVCNAVRNDLQHPNEYIRGATLRFLQKMKEPELLEPLVPTARSCLEHRHAYVRKQAVLTLWTVYKNHPDMIADAPELVESFLATESDPGTVRNALEMLMHTDLDRAVAYLRNNHDGLVLSEEMVQLAVLELIKLARVDASDANKALFLQCVFALLEPTNSSAVKYEASTTLTLLVQTPTAVVAAAKSLLEIARDEHSNNVKIISLGRVQQLHQRHGSILEDLVMDVLAIFSTPDADVRSKVTNLALAMVTSKTIKDVVAFFKKELVRTLDSAPDPAVRHLLIQALHTIAVRYTDLAEGIIAVLVDFLVDPLNTASNDVVVFFREAVEKLPKLRSAVLSRLIASLGRIQTAKVLRGALWIIGDYASAYDVPAVFQQLQEQALGPIPLKPPTLLDNSEDATSLTANGATAAASNGVSHQPKILPDGTYATENTLTVSAIEHTQYPLRSIILDGDFFTASVLAGTLTKLVLHYAAAAPTPNDPSLNSYRALSMLAMTSIVRVGHMVPSAIDEDSEDRIIACLKALASLSDDTDAAAAAASRAAFLDNPRKAYTAVVAHKEQQDADARAKVQIKDSVAVQAPLFFRALSTRQQQADQDEKIDSEAALEDVTQAVQDPASAAASDLISKLSRVVQMTGYSDAIYAETYVTIHQYDIFLDVLVVNQTPDTLQDLTLEFATLGDLRVVERPEPRTFGPHAFHSFKTTIKVSSTETGVIFGNVFFDRRGSGSSSEFVVLNDIHIDILDYIKPATCSEHEFRTMWTEFEWENKVNVKTSISSLREYLDQAMASTNMSCLTPDAALDDGSAFLSANLYARSIFGEDALANLSVEKVSDGSLQGHVRIRAKTQGIALSLGDRITVQQKQS